MVNRLLVVLDVLLLVVGGSLGIHLYRIWTATPSAAPRPPAVASGAALSPPATAAARTLSPSALGIIAERNLFSPTRTELTEPPKPVTATPAGPVRPVEKPRLYGVVLGADGGSRAYLWDPQSRKVFGYKVGDSVAESRLEQIAADRVVLRRSGETFEVLLRDPTKPKPAAPPPPPATTGVPRPVVPGSALPEQPGASEGAPAVPGQPQGQPFVPTLRPGVPTFPPRPRIRIPSGVPGQPQPPREAGS